MSIRIAQSPLVEPLLTGNHKKYVWRSVAYDKHNTTTQEGTSCRYKRITRGRSATFREGSTVSTDGCGKVESNKKYCSVHYLYLKHRLRDLLIDGSLVVAFRSCWTVCFFLPINWSIHIVVTYCCLKHKRNTRNWKCSSSTLFLLQF